MRETPLRLDELFRATAVEKAELRTTPDFGLDLDPHIALQRRFSATTSPTTGYCGSRRSYWTGSTVSRSRYDSPGTSVRAIAAKTAAACAENSDT
jgi:hypothetical protein